MSGQSLVGRTGRVVVAVRGGSRAGEVRVVVGGLPQVFLAFSPAALPVGTDVLVVAERGQRCVDVEPWPHTFPSTEVVGGAQEAPDVRLPRPQSQPGDPGERPQATH